ncbi:MAG: DUF308 domain-containing protein [Clostridia bacterium]|nr:DUF308 domain-containing protein [Clostridia bacterium]
MKRTEKIVLALLTISFGVLLIVLKGGIISILMTVLGVGLIAFGLVDLLNRTFPPAVIKTVIGAIVILCGWVIVKAVLYVLAAALLIVGILLLYEKIKSKTVCPALWQTICEYAVPVVFLLIGLCLLFNQGNTVEWVFILSGSFTIVEGGLLLVNGLYQD